MELQKIIAEPTSAEDLFQIAGKKCNVYEYGQLKDYDDLDDLFENRYDEDNFDDSSAIILYKTDPNFGHWTIVSKNDDEYNYLDSYGNTIDDPLSYMTKRDNNKLGQKDKYLAKMMLKKMNGGKKIFYNNAKLQKLDPNVSTCGRYCAMYLKYSYMNIDDFAKLIKKMSKKMKMSNDELVSYLSMVGSNPALKMKE